MNRGSAGWLLSGGELLRPVGRAGANPAVDSGATDEWLGRLAPQVRAGKADATPDPYDDPISLYERTPTFG